MDILTFTNTNGGTIDLRFRALAAPKPCAHRSLEWSDGDAELAPHFADRWDRHETPAAGARCRKCGVLVKLTWFALDADGNERPMSRREVCEIVARGNGEATA